MTVTLEEIETGNSSVMHDSLFQPANGFNYINVWTTMDIKPEHTYRLVAERPDGAASSVTVTTPPDFATPTLIFPFPYDCRGRLTIQDVERLADVHWRFYYKINSEGFMRERHIKFPIRDKIDPTGPQMYRGFLVDDINKHLPEGEIVDSERTIFVAAGGPEWNEEIPSIEDLEYALPETASNIKNGVGYMLGIVSKTIPFECQEDYP